MQNQPEIINQNGVILKASNPDPRVVKYFEEQNKIVEIKDGKIYISQKPNTIGVSTIFTPMNFLIKVTLEDGKAIIEKLNENLPSASQSWTYMAEQQIFITKISSVELKTLGQKINSVGLGNYFLVQKLGNPQDDVNLILRKEKEATLFDLLTILNTTFPQSSQSRKKTQELNAENKDDSATTYSNLMHELKISPQIKNSPVLEQKNSLPTPNQNDLAYRIAEQAQIYNFITDLSDQLETIIENKLLTNEHDNSDDVENQLKSLISELYQDILSGEFNKEMFVDKNSKLFSFQLPPELTTKIYLCMDIVKNKSITNDNDVYAKIKGIFKSPSFPTKEINYQNFRDKFIDSLQHEHTRFALSDKELTEKMAKDLEEVNTNNNCKTQ